MSGLKLLKGNPGVLMRQKCSWNEADFPNCILLSQQIKIFKATYNFFKTPKNFDKKVIILNEDQVCPFLNFHFSLQTFWRTGNLVHQGPFQLPQISVSFLLLYRRNETHLPNLWGSALTTDGPPCTCAISAVSWKQYPKWGPSFGIQIPSFVVMDWHFQPWRLAQFFPFW